MISMPTYIGLRVSRYTPPITSALVAWGVSGLTVVFAFLKRRYADAPIATPNAAVVRAAGQRAGNSKSSDGAVRATSHISKAVATPTNGGGTRSSSQRIRARQP